MPLAKVLAQFAAYTTFDTLVKGGSIYHDTGINFIDIGSKGSGLSAASITLTTETARRSIYGAV